MAGVRTSESDPLRVNWLPAKWEGKVGLTFAPGKHQEDALTGVWRRDLSLDLDLLVNKHRTVLLVSLLEDQEFGELRIPNLVVEAQSRGIVVERLPIRDGGLPRSLEDVERLVVRIIESASAGRNVVIHCKGGLGRAGTIGGCVLVAAGMTADEALRDVQRARGDRAPENDEQKQFVRDFADYIAQNPLHIIE